MPARAERQTPEAAAPDEPATASRRFATRERLLNAARGLFERLDYFQISVEQIVKAAGLSRGAFYLHYPSKEALLVDLVREDSAKLDGLYKELARSARPTKVDIRNFVERAIRVAGRSKQQLSLNHQAASYNPDVWRTFPAGRDRRMGILGQTIAAFRVGPKATARDKRRRAAAHQLFYQLEQLCLYATFAGEMIDVLAQVDVLVDNFQTFIAEHGE